MSEVNKAFAAMLGARVEERGGAVVIHDWRGRAHRFKGWGSRAVRRLLESMAAGY